MIEECIKLLENNYNLILTGAPGTGKTYLAKEIAKTMGAEIAFVQFHPSYDYTDFVEGLRPKDNGNGNIGFERRDGIFKDFCKKALKKISNSQPTTEEIIKTNDLKEAFKMMVRDVRNKKVTAIPLKTKGRNINVVECKDEDTIVLKSQNKNSKGPYDVHFEQLKNISLVYRNSRELKSATNKAIKKVDSKIFHESAYWAVLNYLYTHFYDEDALSSSMDFTNQKFVFIIDEINRGDISKILGELFFSIDPGYRGEEGKVKTQYQNLIKEDDTFSHGFFVPKNVYIIGTMNDIDRSVESMDFAMRRRFAWKEILANENVGMLDAIGTDKDEAIKRMESLNKAIEETEGLSTAYHIGASYFLKLNLYKDDADKKWASLWNNHIKGVLYEYLRGNENIEEAMSKLKNAYDKPKDTSTQVEVSEQATQTDAQGRYGDNNI